MTDKDYTVLITAYLDPALKEKLRIECFRQDISKSELINDALKLYFQEIENKSWGR